MKTIIMIEPIPLNTQEKRQEQLCRYNAMISSCRLTQRDSELSQEHSELATFEKVPSLQPNYQVSSLETLYNLSLTPHIYISQKSPES